jgi:hypothetical protein
MDCDQRPLHRLGILLQLNPEAYNRNRFVTFLRMFGRWRFEKNSDGAVTPSWPPGYVGSANAALQLVRATRGQPAPGASRLMPEPGIVTFRLTCIHIMHINMHADDSDPRRRSGC